MADTIRTRASLTTLFADNNSGDISPQDLRDFLISTPLRETTTSASVTSDLFEKPTTTAAPLYTESTTALRILNGSYSVGTIQPTTGALHTITFSNPFNTAPTAQLTGQRFQGHYYTMIKSITTDYLVLLYDNRLALTVTNAKVWYTVIGA